MDSIGIGITAHNRHNITELAYKKILEYLPRGAKVVIVDDASTEPWPYADKVNKQQEGIAASKNACLALLEECEHIFLFDNDTWPVVDEWWKPYVESGENHLCMSFEHNSKGQRLSHSVYKTGEYKGLNVYNAPNGCMLYVRRAVLGAVGGMDPAFGTWGMEHHDWSMRIHEAGMTPHAYMDVPNSLELFHASDYFGDVPSSVPEQVRRDHALRNKSILEDRTRPKYVSYG